MKESDLYLKINALEFRNKDILFTLKNPTIKRDQYFSNELKSQYTLNCERIGYLKSQLTFLQKV